MGTKRIPGVKEKCPFTMTMIRNYIFELYRWPVPF